MIFNVPCLFFIYSYFIENWTYNVKSTPLKIEIGVGDLDRITFFFFEMFLFAIFTIGITAFLGVILHSIGKALFGRKKKREYVDFFQRIQEGWNKVGGKGNSL